MNELYNDRSDIYLDRHHKKLGGVCAGVANFLGLPRAPVRVAAVLGLVIFPQEVLLAYGLAYLVLDHDPNI